MAVRSRPWGDPAGGTGPGGVLGGSHGERTDSLERNLRAADAAVERDDRERYAALVQEFHVLIITGVDNSKLHPLPDADESAGVLPAGERIAEPAGPRHPVRPRASVVLELILAKDGDSAEQVTREHVRASRRALLAGLPIGGRSESLGLAGS
ncbi:FCD domain-containing protein [Streptomyces sp. NPDC058464]|uniref:FCD domain-containing protein n=1 Tax=Streptomyces sp. NPDC058464 TaxID=3346511 RepID=UPI0036662774